MSKISLSGNASGTGTFTITSPNGNTDRTLTLPDESGTVLTSGGAIDVNASAPADSVVINSSGNVGIGTSSPATNFHVYNATRSLSLMGSATSFTNPYSTFSGQNISALQIISANTTGAALQLGYTGTGSGDGIGGIQFITTGTSGTEKRGALIGSSLESSASTSVTANLAFLTTNAGTIAERARITSGGDFLMGTTSVAGSGVSIQPSSSNIYQRNSGATAGTFRYMGADSGNNFIVYNQNNTGVYLTNGGTSWTANSDERLKTALTPFENAVQKICTLRTGTGRYLTDDETVSRSFLLAQDVQKVLPEAVNVQPDEQETLGLSYTDLIPLLTAAIQELKAINDAQASRIETLEAKVAALETQE